MVKEIPINPHETTKSELLKFSDIPINAYKAELSQERVRWGDRRLRQVLRDMIIVREFETMLDSFKSTGKYHDVEYSYKGPAHLSVGQEGVAVGMALELVPKDQIFGSHRSHGEIIAKGLSAIGILNKFQLQDAMMRHDEGKLLSFVHSEVGCSAADEAEIFLLSGTLAEIFMRDIGFNRGMSGSMHAFFTPFGAFPNNAIVGGSSGIAVGAALYSQLQGSDNICIANLGDGSAGCGLVWESMNFAAMGQFKTLWQHPFNRNPPMLFCFMNNFYAMGGQTRGETMSWDRLARIGSGINVCQMHAETVDGSNPLAVADAISRKRAILIDGRGPALLDIECYRYSGHSTTDTNAYRSREEIKAWKEYDPIFCFQTRLVEGGVISLKEVNDLKLSVREKILSITRAVVNRHLAPPINLYSNPTAIGEMTFNNESVEIAGLAGDLLKKPADSKIVKSIARKARFGIGENGEKLSNMRALTLRDALSESILYHLSGDQSLIAYGEECRDWGGAFGVYRGLAEIIPYHRLFNSPISEAAIVSTAVGYALAGGRVLIELMYADFIGRAGDEIFNQLAKWQAMSAGRIQLPVVLRTSVGSKYGAQHSQDWSSLVAHIPGLKVIYPATPFDAKGLIATALSGNDPTVIFESQRLYDTVEIFNSAGVPESYYQVPFGRAALRLKGEHLTILSIGPLLYTAMEAASHLKDYKIDAEVIDVRTLVPFDYDTIVESISRTRRLLIVSEAVERGSFAKTIAANVMQLAFKEFKAAPIVLGAPNWIAPGAEMEETYSPQANDIIEATLKNFFPEKRANRRGMRDWDLSKLSKRGI
ncbi:MAG: thiamine pyrophosphate-dependent enzyme [Pseudomonadota bacterium]|nr:thiamine pyrophosphate-dependent enzyme [Pseudomonadota bacterium]